MSKEGVRRYNLVLPEVLFDQVREVSGRKHVSVAAILRQFVELGLEVEHAQQRGASLILREGGKDTGLIII